MRKDVCFTVIALTWVLSAILASPLAIFREYGSFTLEPGHTIQVYAVTHLQHHVSESNVCTDRSPHFPPHSFPLIFLVLLTSVTLPPLSSHPSFLLSLHPFLSKLLFPSLFLLFIIPASPVTAIKCKLCQNSDLVAKRIQWKKSFFLVTFLKLLIIYHIILITFGLEQTLSCHFVWTSHLLGIPKGKRKKNVAQKNCNGKMRLHL